LKTGKQYKTVDFEERNRLQHNLEIMVAYFPTYLCDFDIDTIGKKNKANVNLIINYSYQEKDSTKNRTF
jgi:hypothetical protein